MNVVFMLAHLFRQRHRDSDLFRVCCEGYSCITNDYRRMMASSETCSETCSESLCDNCGNPVRDCQLIECLVEMVLNELHIYVKKACYSCQREAEGHFVNSQLDHDICMMMDLEDRLKMFTREILSDLLKSPAHLDELWKTRMPILLNDIFTGLSLGECMDRMEEVRNNYTLDEQWCEKYYRTILEKVINRGEYYEM